MEYGQRRCFGVDGNGMGEVGGWSEDIRRWAGIYSGGWDEVHLTSFMCRQCSRQVTLRGRRDDAGWIIRSQLEDRTGDDGGLSVIEKDRLPTCVSLIQWTVTSKRNTQERISIRKSGLHLLYVRTGVGWAGGVGWEGGRLGVESSGRLKYICTTAHKNFSFFPALARALPFASVRFDFRGCGESDGTFSWSGFLDEVQDIQTVLSHLRSRNWRPLVLIGHSRGGNSVLFHAQKYPYAVRFVVNISARYFLRARMDEEWVHRALEVKKNGYYNRPLMRNGKEENHPVTVKVVEELASLTEHIKEVDSSVIFGLTSHLSLCFVQRVPVEESNAIPTHTLRLIRGGYHNFRVDPALSDQVVPAILAWLNDELTSMSRFWSVHGDGRVVDVRGVKNFRDVGGYQCEGGGVVTMGMVYRSSE
ncbi:Alpha/Beta hydrolase protein [Blyttiomyces helicus]|uniref:Alpha/Beta hydrolase protein n=1 Tax=Blyttiomyces helicus TaxID=388810 RepID=A0A4V1IQ80_9FUNG|nr:Alpha/Beta hydrolase protein [Blyttiomyces helicus]|eukprot:RKO85627.1 Alpha/Beta hydrolase protein [Blyttiomyces helicus]